MFPAFFVVHASWIGSYLIQRSWEAGEQVFISYGRRSNDELLQRYGFVESDNPNDIYRITGLLNKVAVWLMILVGLLPRIKCLDMQDTILYTQF